MCYIFENPGFKVVKYDIPVSSPIQLIPKPFKIVQNID